MQITITITIVSKRDMNVPHRQYVDPKSCCVPPHRHFRMLVYEYMEKSNLDKWLHHDDSETSSLTWDIRMRILLGTARG